MNDVDVTILNERVQYYDKDGKLITESVTDYSRMKAARIFTQPSLNLMVARAQEIRLKMRIPDCAKRWKDGLRQN